LLRCAGPHTIGRLLPRPRSHRILCARALGAALASLTAGGALAADPTPGAAAPASDPGPSGGWTAAGIALAATGITFRIGAAYAYREGDLSCFELISLCSWAGVAAIPLPLVGSALIGYDTYRLGAIRAARAGATPTPLPTLIAVRFGAIAVTGAALVVEGAVIAWNLVKAARCGPDAVRSSPDCLGDTLFIGSIIQAAAELTIVIAIPTALYTVGYEKGLARRPAPLARGPLLTPPIVSPLVLPGGAGLALAARF
jgi:hypothetical protein